MANLALTAATRQRYNQPYDAYSLPYPTYGSMVNEANRRAANDINAAIAGLVRPGDLSKRRDSEQADITALTTAATKGQQGIYDSMQAYAQSVPNMLAQAQNATAPIGNAVANAAGVPGGSAPVPAAANAVAAALAQAQANTSLGAVSATQARGNLENLAAGKRYTEAMTQRDRDVSQIKAGLPSLRSEYLDKLRAEAFQGTTAKLNYQAQQRQMNLDERFRRDQLGENSRQFNASLEQSARQFADQMGLEYDKLNQQQQQFLKEQARLQAGQDADVAATKANNNWHGTGVSESTYQNAINTMQDYVLQAVGKTREVTADEPITTYYYKVLNKGKRLKDPSDDTYDVKEFQAPLHNVNALGGGQPTGLPPGWEFLRAEQTGVRSAGMLVPDVPAFQQLYGQAAGILRQRGLKPAMASQLAFQWVSNYLSNMDYNNPMYGAGVDMNGLLAPPGGNVTPKPKPKPKKPKKPTGGRTRPG